MSQEPPTKKVRKGTRSCVECRQRKLRCDWPDDGASICRNCSTRGRTCEVQERPISTADFAKRTSRTRLKNLEDDVSMVWKAMHRMENMLGFAPFNRTQEQQPRQTETPGDDREDDDSESDESAVVFAGNLPTHLGYLFDGEQTDSARPDIVSSIKSGRRSQKLASLRALLLPREDVVRVMARTSSWMVFHSAVFPALRTIQSGEVMLVRYNQLMAQNEGEQNVIQMAAVLLSIAMTVQHSPEETTAPAVKSIPDGSRYIRDVSDAVERAVLDDDKLAGTLDGIEVSMLHLRLQLSRTKLRKTWLLLRRVIALAELMALPRAAMLVNSPHPHRTPNPTGHSPHDPASSNQLMERKAAAWESICMIDRIYSVLWSLPLATSNYPFSRQTVVDDLGRLKVRAVLFNLADTASRVIDLDQAYAMGTPLADQIDPVMAVDRELRDLAASTPAEWWKSTWSEHNHDSTLQYWHGYLMIRTHFQLALASHGDSRFGRNFTICLAASQELARRYISLRPIVAVGFFANPLLDLQAFTATIFLLLANLRASGGTTFMQPLDMALNTELIDSVLAAMNAAWRRGEANFARQGANAIESLKSLFQRPHASDTEQFSLTLPLVGKVRVSRKSLAETTDHVQPGKASGTHQRQAGPAMASETFVPPSEGALSFSMEYSGDHPLLADEIFTDQDWLSWSGWDADT